MQIGCSQNNCWKRIAAAGLHRDADSAAKLVVNGTDLAFTCGNCYTGTTVHRSYLTVNPLKHGFIAAVRRFEYFDELFGTYLIGERPEPFA